MGSSAQPRYLLPPLVIQVDCPSSDWKEYCTKDGYLYYFNSKTGITCWEKPVELMDPIERADALTLWKEYCTPFARSYYYNKMTKESVWCIPDELKVARELIIRASMFYEICKEKNLSDICSEDRKSGGQTLHACSSLYLHPLSGKGDDPKSSGQMLRAFSSLYPHPLSGKASKSYKIYEEKDLLDICSKDPKSGDEHNEFEETKFLCDWLQHHLAHKVDKVQVSKLLMSPFALNSAKLGFAPEMQSDRMLGSTRKLREGGWFFIINPDHPVIKELNAVLKIKHDSKADKAVADFLYEVALISSGYAPSTPAELYSTIYLILEISLAGRWGRSSGGRWGRSNGEANTGANSSGALAIVTSGPDSLMEGLLSLVLGILKFKLRN